MTIEVNTVSNKDIYDSLADEYESRLESLLPITRETMDFFERYLKPKCSILDIGCAVGTAISVLRERGFKMTGLEISPKMLEYARKRNPGVKFILGDFLQSEIEDKYDAVLTFAFVHLFSKKNAAFIFERIRNLLKPNGTVFVSTTDSAESKEGWFVKDDYDKKVKRFRKYWTENEIREFMEKAGFEILALKKFEDPFRKIWMDYIIRKI